MVTETGGSAFPTTAVQSSSGAFPESGLTMRDYFAAKVLQGICSQALWEKCTPQQVATWAYEQADSMIQARSL